MRTGRPVESKREFLEKLSDKHPNVQMISKTYEGQKSVYDFKCSCGLSWSSTAYKVFRSAHGCPDCRRIQQKKAQTLSKRTVESRILKTHGYAIHIVGPYTGRGKQHKFRCSECGHLWKTQPGHVMTASGCPECSAESNKKKRADGLKKTRVPYEEVVRRIEEVHGKNIIMMGQYRGFCKKHRFKCYTCLHTWKTSPQHVAVGKTGCPACANLVRARKSKWGGVKELEINGVPVRVQGYEPQAIRWLLDNRNLTMEDLKLDNSGEVPRVAYNSGRRNRYYYPDMYVQKWNRIIEVKSPYTLGFGGKKKWFKVNQRKAKACVDAGFKFTLMVMKVNGERFWVPPKWYLMKHDEVMRQCAFVNSDNRPSNWKTLVKRRAKELGL